MFLIIGERSRAASRSNENLCLKCWNYSGIKYSLDDREERCCTRLSGNQPMALRGPVSQCSDFQDRTKPGKEEMNKMAWIIEPSKRKVGFDQAVRFIPPTERTDLERG